MGVAGDGGTGTAMFSVTCNAAGTAWESAGDAIAKVECSVTGGSMLNAQFLLTRNRFFFLKLENLNEMMRSNASSL